MKKLFLTFLLAIITFSAASQVTYNVDAGQEDVKMNVSAALDCEEGDGRCPVNSWRLEWRIPENAEITNITDSIGEIEDYTIQENVVSLETNEGPKRKSEMIKIEMEVEEGAEEITDGLYSRSISLPSLSDADTSGQINVENLLSGKMTEGFETTFSNDSLRFKGSGASNAKINFGSGEKRGNYEFFGDSSRNTSLAYRIAVATTGLRQSYPRIPVAVFSEEEYASKASEWSQGEYSSGVVRMRKSLDENFPAVLVEETVHAFNDEALSFDRTSSTWLDEGIAGYTQSMMRKNLFGEEKAREVFGNSNTYTENREGSLYEVEKPSKGDPDELWQYYQEERDFMKAWSPQKSQNRDFGYAYSELIIRNYVANNNSVRELYRKIEPEQLDSNDEKWSFYSKYLELEPCNYGSRERFDSCLERLNNYDYPVYYVHELPEKQNDNVTVEEVKVPNNTREEYYRNTELFQEGFVNSIIPYLESLWGQLKEWI